ncbi:hypothetical protein GIB67_026232 [Kingdonia uniflora]|uniref:Uncharacterized protein n=1 Tax=Kingdonia uniflora TaxID=39325 RepID=A0A7J7LA30_9MAGN|nr:hypothetical protein GIB67_026232 [Kingdonia uniflora]
MEFTKWCLARVQEEVDDFLKANPEEVIDLEGDENLSTTKVGEVTNQDLAGANIMLRDEPLKKRNDKAGRIKGALEKGKGKKGLAQCKMVEVLTVLEWASKQGVMMEDELVGSVLPETKNRLELYQS